MNNVFIIYIFTRMSVSAVRGVFYTVAIISDCSGRHRIAGPHGDALMT